MAEKNNKGNWNFRKYIIRGIITFIILAQVPIVFVMAQTATVKWDSNVRREASTSSEVVTSVLGSQQITIEDQTEGNDGYTWYYITTSSGNVGYIREDLVTLGGTSQGTITSTSTPSEDLGDDIVQVVTNSANIRNSSSTSGSIVANVSRGVELYIQSETTGSDGNVWYEIAFTYQGQTVEGYIRSDLVTYEEMEGADVTPSETEIMGTLSEEEELEEETNDTEFVPQTTPESTTNSEQSEYTFITTDLEPILPYGYDLVQVALGGEDISAWKKGDFFIFYAIKSDGSEGFIRYDSIYKTIQRYEEVEGYPGGMFANMNANITMSVLLIVLIITVISLIILAIKYNYSKIEEQFAREEEKNEQRSTYSRNSAKHSRVKASDKGTRYDEEYDDAYDEGEFDEELEDNEAEFDEEEYEEEEYEEEEYDEEYGDEEYDDDDEEDDYIIEEPIKPVKPVKPSQKSKARPVASSKKTVAKPIKPVAKQVATKKAPPKKKMGMETKMLSELEIFNIDSL